MSLKKTKAQSFNLNWICKLLVPIFLIYILFLYYVKNYPERIFESSVLTMQYVQEILNSSKLEKVSVLAIGDSTVGAALNLNIIEKNAYSLVTPGGNSRESYFILKKFLANHPKPVCILMNVSGNNDSLYYDKFWKSFIVHLYRINDLNTIWNDSYENKFHPFTHIQNISYWIEIALSKINLLNFPWYQFIQSFRGMSRFIFSHQYYIKFIRKSRGQKVYAETDFEVSPDLEYLTKDFMPFPLDDFYFKKILNLVNDQNLELVYIDIPFANVSNHQIENFLSKNLARKKELASHFPKVHFFETQKAWSNSYFSNINHLNELGAIEFSKELKSQLPKNCLNF